LLQKLKLPYLIGNNKIAQISDDQSVLHLFKMSVRLSPTLGKGLSSGINLSIAFLPFDNWPTQAGRILTITLPVNVKILIRA